MHASMQAPMYAPKEAYRELVVGPLVQALQHGQPQQVLQAAEGAIVPAQQRCSLLWLLCCLTVRCLAVVPSNAGSLQPARSPPLQPWSSACG